MAISYHSRFVSTSCPGNILRKMVQDGSLAKGRPGESTPSSPGKGWPGRHLRLTSPMMRGADVKLAQQRLNAKGANPKLSTDSVYGPMTAAAVKTYQRTHKLTQDGIIGPKTWDSLMA
jgi:N-acetylmuramoyl-L-alanine amidase